MAMRIRPMQSKAEYQAYLDSVRNKQTQAGQASYWQMRQLIEQNTDKIVIDRQANKIRFLGQFDVVVADCHIIHEQSILTDNNSWFKNGLPPIEYI